MQTIDNTPDEKLSTKDKSNAAKVKTDNTSENNTEKNSEPKAEAEKTATASQTAPTKPAAVPYVVTLNYIPTPAPPANKGEKEKSNGIEAKSGSEGAATPTGNVVLSSDTSLIDQLIIASNVIPIASLDPQTPEIITITNSFFVFAEESFVAEGKTLSTSTKTTTSIQAGDSLEYEEGKISSNDNGQRDKGGVIVKNNSASPMTFGLAQIISASSNPCTDPVPVVAVYVPPWQSILLPLDISYEMWTFSKNSKTLPAAGTLFDVASVQDNIELKLSIERPAALAILAGETLVNGVS